MTYIPGGGGKISTSQDVAMSNPTSGQALVYDAGLGKWVNGAVTTDNVVGLGTTLASIDQRLDALDNKGNELNPVLGFAAAPSTTSITLSWTAVSGTTESQAQLVIRRASGSAAPVSHTTGHAVASFLASSANSHTDTNLSASTQYSYAAFIVDEAGRSSVAATVTTTTTTINGGSLKIDAGGTGTGDFGSDAYYTGGGVYTTTNPDLAAALAAQHHSVRYGMTQYRLPSTTRALVKIDMVELTFGATGRRVFDIIANNGVVYRNIDLFAIGGMGGVVSRTVVTDPVDGFVTVGFRASVDNAVISAIEVSDGTGMPLTPIDTSGGGGPPGEGMLAYPAKDFIDSCGVAVHFVYSGQYGNLGNNTTDQNNMVQMLQYLRINRIRDGWGYDRDGIVNFIKNTLGPALGGVELSLTHDSRDWGFSFGTSVSVAEAKKWVAEHKRTGVLPYIKFAEGANEWDVGGKYAEAKSLAQNVKQAYAEEATAGHVLVGAMSYADTNTTSKYQAHGLATSLDFGTAHDYTGVDYHMNDNIMNRVQTNWGYIVPGKPVISTETDITNGTANGGYKGIPESLGAAFTPRVYLDHWRWGKPDQINGATIAQQGNIQFLRTYKYELINKPNAGTDFESNFGFFREDRTPKPAATAMRNLLGLLQDAGVKPSQKRLALTLSGGNAKTKGALFCKSDGSYWLALWQQERLYDGTNELNPAPVNVTVGLPAAATTVRYYKPGSGTAATNTFSSINSLSVASAKEVTIIEIVGLP